MGRALIPIGFFAVLVAFLGVGLFLDPREVPSPLVGKPAPSFTLPTLDDANRQVSLADFRGQVFLFNVWGSWCVACRQEHDVLLAIHRSGEVLEQHHEGEEMVLRARMDASALGRLRRAGVRVRAEYPHVGRARGVKRIGLRCDLCSVRRRVAVTLRTARRQKSRSVPR